jgi:hypothetical protein
MRLAKLNPGVVVLPAVATLSKALHDGKTLILKVLTGHTITLPPAVGSGATFNLVEQLAPTSNTTVVKVSNTIDAMFGSLVTSTGGAAGGAGSMFWPGPTDDTLTLNRGTTGGVTNGEWLQFVDVAPGAWMVNGRLAGSGAVATPFSATV